MKKIILGLSILFSGAIATAQVITDTVSLGAGYANQAWYSLNTGDKLVASKAEWDIAFDCSSFGYSILTNSANGVTLWNYSSADTSGWATVDTTGISAWEKRYNGDTSWEDGAFSRYGSANQFDVGWGIYSTLTHFIVGDSIQIIKLANGAYKKISIQGLVSGAFRFKYANLDGSDEQQVSLSKSTYSGKNFAYYSLQNNTALNREPASANWDLLFTNYIAFIPSAYTVSGVLLNNNTTAAKVGGVGDKETFNDWQSATFVTAINTIGYDWKSFTGGQYVFKDSLVYLVKTKVGDVWKLIFRGFGGSANGNFIFTKERIYKSTTGLNQVENSLTVVVYPNPIVSGNDVNVLLPETGLAQITITDLSGRVHTTTQVMGSAAVSTTQLAAGVYIMQITQNGKVAHQKLIIQ